MGFVIIISFRIKFGRHTHYLNSFQKSMCNGIIRITDPVYTDNPNGFRMGFNIINYLVIGIGGIAIIQEGNR